jgi:prepilin-type N-terminal cleavage/methylation domain-containing protein
MRDHVKTKRAFTLIELLTVIAIIGVLIALLFPAIKSALTKAEVSKAQTAITGLATAFQHYYAEYGKWPIADTASNNTYIVDTNLVALLQGAATAPPPNQPTGLVWPAYNGAFINITTATLQGNPRGIPLLAFKQVDIDGLGNFVDPWKRPYYVRFDVSYANAVEDPFTSGANVHNVNGGFLIWSSGPDGQYDNNGDTPPSPVNKDNVKSW